MAIRDTLWENASPFLKDGRSGRFRMTPVKGVLRELPRATKIGEPEGLWHRTDSLGEIIYIPRRFYGDLRAAEGAASPTDR